MTETPGAVVKPYRSGEFLWDRLCWPDAPTHYPDHPSEPVPQPCGLCGAIGQPITPAEETRP